MDSSIVNWVCLRISTCPRFIYGAVTLKCNSINFHKIVELISFSAGEKNYKR